MASGPTHDSSLDALLDDALDAFDTPASTSATSASQPPPPQQHVSVASTSTDVSSQKPKKPLAFDPLSRSRRPPPPSTQPTTEQQSNNDGGGDDDAEFDDFSAGISQLLAELAKVHPADQEHQQSSTQRGEGDEEDLMKATLRALADQTVTRGAGGATSTGTGANVEEDLLSDELLERLAAQLQGLGGFPSGGEGGGGGGDGHGEDHPTSTDSESLPPGMASLVDSIMHQLISKEVLYQPMKDIGAKYPEWLSSHRGTLTPDEVTQYEEQHAYIQKICGVYETDPGNYPKLIELLQEMQQRGQPPQEIIDELAPGMSCGPDGLPVGGGGGNLPDPGNCSIQ